MLHESCLTADYLLRILIIITSLGIGGAERLVTSLADRFVAKGHKVMLVVLTGELNMRPWNGWTGLTIDVCWYRLEIYYQLNMKSCMYDQTEEPVMMACLKSTCHR